MNIYFHIFEHEEFNEPKKLKIETFWPKAEEKSSVVFCEADTGPPEQRPEDRYSTVEILHVLQNSLSLQWVLQPSSPFSWTHVPSDGPGLFRVEGQRWRQIQLLSNQSSVFEQTKCFNVGWSFSRTFFFQFSFFCCYRSALKRKFCQNENVLLLLLIMLWLLQFDLCWTFSDDVCL